RAIYRAPDVTDEFITGPAGSKKPIASKKPNKSTTNTKSDKVFIVHGHDDAAKIKTARFVEQLDYKAIILHEQASSGRTIIEKIEQFTDVGFAVVLYTPDDIGNAKDNADDLQLRARQNVVFEHGFLIGKLGRDRVVALVDGAIELPNDISGVVYIKMDEANAWHLQLAKEMKQAGFNIDMNKLV
ncbi:TIR domain-containing protein, partial [Salmonella enterica]